MRIIGITGPTGSGKTTALLALSRLGVRVVDCDALYHELVLNCAEMLSEIEAAFPGVCEGGKLDRKKLGSVVFAKPELLAKLNKITHKYVSAEVEKLIADEKERGGRAVAIDAIALIESGIAKLCKPTAAVVASEDVRIKRIMLREGISEEYARLRMSAQKPCEWYEQRCAVVLKNNGDISEFEDLCYNTFSEILDDKRNGE